MKSIEISMHNRSGIGKCCKRSACDSCSNLCCRQTSQS